MGWRGGYLNGWLGEVQEGVVEFQMKLSHLVVGVKSGGREGSEGWRGGRDGR